MKVLVELGRMLIGFLKSPEFHLTVLVLLLALAAVVSGKLRAEDKARGSSVLVPLKIKLEQSPRRSTIP